MYIYLPLLYFNNIVLRDLHLIIIIASFYFNYCFLKLRSLLSFINIIYKFYLLYDRILSNSSLAI